MLQFGLNEAELKLPRLPIADRRLRSADRRRGDRDENPDIAVVPIAAQAAARRREEATPERPGHAFAAQMTDRATQKTTGVVDCRDALK